MRRFLCSVFFWDSPTLGIWLSRVRRALNPQRPFSTVDPSPFVNEGSDVVDVKRTVRELQEKPPSEGYRTVRQGSALTRFQSWHRNRRLTR